MSLFLAVLPLAASATLLPGYGQKISTFPNITACAAIDSFYSCENTTAITNTCCSPTPGGLVLQTQFWSTYTGLERKGQLLPEGSWTIHGLWPDNCDGSFDQYCDLDRQYDPKPDPANFTRNGEVVVVKPWTGESITSMVSRFNRPGLLEYMNAFWVNQGAPNDAFWAHEFSKHFTCTSTFDLECYGPTYKKHAEVVDAFDATIRAFQQFPTFDLLSAAGIVPSNKTTYPIGSIINALKSQTGAVPHVGCTQNGTVLSEVWYYMHVYGTEQFGNFKPVETTFKTNCVNTTGIHYPERSRGSERSVKGIDFRN